MARGADIQERLIQFGARIIKVCGALPKSMAGKHLSGQLLRSGTAPAAPYGEARSAESPSDFVHKLKIAVKELNESEVWLRMIIASELIESYLLSAILDECIQLERILGASISTARKNAEN